VRKSCVSVLGMVLFIAANGLVWGQGCVAVRPMSCSASAQMNDMGLLGKGQWQVSTSYRYFESFRHYRGDEEETNRIDNGTQVINDAHSVDLGITRMFTSRFGITANVPIIYYDRSSLYEHYGNGLSSNPNQERFNTGARGIGDIRITPNFWVWDPEKATGKGNISIGVGLKFPTGDDNVKDDFHRRDANGNDFTVNRPVDQSIQLGDGGWGLNTEFQAFRSLNNETSLYVNGFYLFNPRNTNDTLTRGTSEGVDPLIVNHSVADQYAARVGVNTSHWARHGILGSLGARIEGVPSKDIFGDSDGFRRPGYIVSVDPSLTFMIGQVNLTMSVPVALYRNRVKSTFDLADPTGQRHGDAAFADYLVNFTFSYRFSNTKQGLSSLQQN